MLLEIHRVNQKVQEEHHQLVLYRLCIPEPTVVLWEMTQVSAQLAGKATIRVLNLPHHIKKFWKSQFQKQVPAWPVELLLLLFPEEIPLQSPLRDRRPLQRLDVVRLWEARLRCQQL